MRDIGKNIKTLRQNKEMTQDALAESLFVTRQTVSNYENGRSRPDLDMLLRIAEVLETDVNTVIYGPPVPPSKKSRFKRLILSGGLCLLLGIANILIHNACTGQPLPYGYQVSGRYMNMLAIKPAFMLVFGWFGLQLLSMCSSLRQLPPRKYKAVRVTVFVLLALFLAIPIPYLIWLGIGFYRSLTQSSVAMVFPHIPVYREAFMAVFKIIDNAPFVYFILGGAFWLLGIPKAEKEVEHT